MNTQDDMMKNNINQNDENSIKTYLFDVLVNLRNTDVVGHTEQSIITDLLDITMDTHGAEFVKELRHICKQKSDDEVFDMLMELHGIEMTKEFIYTYGKMKGKKIGKHLGKCDDPRSAIKNFSLHIQSTYDIKINEKALGNEGQISSKNRLNKNLRNIKKTTSFNPNYINTQGFIEGALSFMTGMQANICINNLNGNKIYFKQPIKYFFGFF
ncbi:MAG: hypothetical protein Q7J10_01220 [Methanosarcinaceae archaeon]|nr:hypothetical protein [Methanosarcinaceae archaeon]